MEVIKGNRAVAYFDILGFKAKINQMPIEKLSSEYESLISFTDGQFIIEDKKIVCKQVCHRYIFSDSIFLIANDDSEDSFIDLVSYSWRMMQIAISMGFPLRGGITYGEIYANLEKKIYLGKSISQAVLLEGSQNWIGAIVDDSAIKRYANIFSHSQNIGGAMRMLLPLYYVPLKDGTRRFFHVLNWRQNMVSEKGIRPLFHNDSSDEKVQAKIDNTLSFAKEIVNTGHAYFNDDLVPEIFRKYYVMNHRPSNIDEIIVNGDEY